MRQRSSRRPQRSPRPTGFTLVEMLVAVALVLLLMSMFAQVFQMAGNSISTQRGIMENDQRARSVQTLLKADLDKRSMRKVVPFIFNEETGAAEADLVKRRGYLYYSENVPSNDWDDVLALTIDARQTLYNPDESEYFGKALPLYPTNPPGSPALTPTQWMATTVMIGGNQVQIDNRNQPEIDDSRTDFNFTGSSPVAEVVYYVRNGNLYRRTLLVRQPGESIVSEQPTDWKEDRFFSRSYRPTSTSTPLTYPGAFQNASPTSPQAVGFYHDFDYSAHPVSVLNGAATAYLYDGTQFNGLTSLDLTGPLEPLPALPNSLAYPPNRFGHNTVNLSGLVPPNEATGIPFGGQPREFGDRLAAGDRLFFVGRLTSEESSNVAFQYPQLTHPHPTVAADGNNPMNTAVAWTDSNGDFVVDGLNGGDRRGEDLLLSYVQAFDVKIWDEAAGMFVDLEGPGAVDFSRSNKMNRIYGPLVDEDANADNSLGGSEDANGNGIWDAPRVFDTWYPFSSPPTSSTRQVLDFNSNGSLDTNENQPPYRPRKFQPVTGAFGTTPTLPEWEPDRFYAAGDRVFPVAAENAPPGHAFYYVCVKEGTSGSGSVPAPALLSSVRIPGTSTQETSGTPPGPTWQAVYNLKPIRAIQITLRYQDPTTSQIRTLTIQHALVD